MDTLNIGIVAAMEREVAGLVKSWRGATLERGGRRWKAFTSGRAVLVVSGIGPVPSAHAAEALAAKGAKVLISAGFAGALLPGMRAGSPLTPEAVVDAETGARFQALFGGGVLVSATHVLGETEKSQLAHRHDAQGVDMEAASVAAAAERHGCGFLAVKAISDTLELALPPLDKFIDGNGCFHQGRFLRHIAVRPMLWPSVARLAMNNRKASRTICGVLDAILQIEDLRNVRGKMRGGLRLSGK
jgi:adenosylhomocysteine nucleosidase